MKITRILAAACFALIFAQPAFAAKLWISEYSSLPGNLGPPPPIAQEPSVTDQTPVDFSGGVTSSAVFGTSTRYVRVICDVQCSVKFGSAPTATNANKMLPALVQEYFGVNPGDRISVIVNP